MKNNVKDYIGLSEEDKKYLKEFDKAVEREFFDNKLIKFTKKEKTEIGKERDKFKADLMNVGKRSSADVDGAVFKKVHVGKKKVNSERGKDGKFVKKEEK